MSRRSPEDFDLLFMQAQLAYKAGQLHQARTLLQQYLDVQNQRQRPRCPAPPTPARRRPMRTCCCRASPRTRAAMTRRSTNSVASGSHAALLRAHAPGRAARQGRPRRRRPVHDRRRRPAGRGRAHPGRADQGADPARRRRVGQAVAVLEAADRDLPDTVEIKYELAMLYERQDRVADLERLLRQVIALDGPCPRLQRAGLHAGRPQPAAARGAGPDHAGAGAGAQRSVHPGQHGLGQVPHGRPGRRGRIPAPRLQHASRGRHRRPPGRSAVEPGQARPGGGAAARRQAQGPDQPRPARHDQAAGVAL